MDDPHAAHARLTRRGLLGAGAVMAAGGYALFPRPVLADIPDQFDGTSFKLAAPDPNPKYGGVLRMGITNRVPHFDLHQSGTYNNLGSMGCLFDNLIRRDPRDGGKAVIPDLAHSWEIAKDRKTYTFYLRKGIEFHDGAELTSEDVKATFDRLRGSASPAASCLGRSAR
jgi:peptide/nickel transport system substrate-binding protein